MENDKKTAKEDILKEFLDSSRRAFFGTNPDAGYEQATKQLDQLVTTGRLTTEEASFLTSQLKAKVTWSKRVFDAQLSRIISELSARLETITNNELTAIEAKLTELEKSVGRGDHVVGVQP